MYELLRRLEETSLGDRDTIDETDPRGEAPSTIPSDPAIPVRLSKEKFGEVAVGNDGEFEVGEVEKVEGEV